MTKLYVVMVGLPARGKSTLARRIRYGLAQQGIRTEIFNNGELRRRFLGRESASPDFFNPANASASAMREELARMNMENARAWLNEQGDVAIIDATHSTSAQRFTILRNHTDYPLLFVECVNTDALLLEESIRRKPRLSEFQGMPVAQALASFKKRIAYYEQVYEPLKKEPCWIRVDAPDSRIVNEAPNNDLPYYAAIRDIVTSRWVHDLYLVRHGETVYNLEGRLGGDPELTPKGQYQAERLAEHFHGINISYVFTSTRLRSWQTALPILGSHPEASAMSLPEFDEIDAGVCEGMRYEDILAHMPLEYAARAANKYSYVYPKGEGYATLKARVARGLRRALFLAGEGSLMVVGHQAINRVLLSLFLFQREADVPYIYIPQNQYYHITVTQQRKLFEMVRYA